MEYCWLSWPHKDRPFSEKTLQYIKSINIMEDIEMLNSQYKFRPICLRNMRLSNTILKKGAAAGLTLGEIGKIWSRTDDEGEVPSIFERLVASARRQADLVSEMHNDRLSPLLDMLDGRRRGKKKVPGLLSADMETYERIKENGSGKAAATPERRERANTTLGGDESVSQTETPKFQTGGSKEGLEMVCENAQEEIAGLDGHYRVGKNCGHAKAEEGLTMETYPTADSAGSKEEEEKTPPAKKLEAGMEEDRDGRKADFPAISRTVSIPSKLFVCNRLG